MPWIDVTNTDENFEFECHLFMRLIKDDSNNEVGSIMQFYSGMPYYAISAEIGRLGPHETLEQAKEAVEQHSWKNAMALAIPPIGKLDA